MAKFVVGQGGAVYIDPEQFKGKKKEKIAKLKGYVKAKAVIFGTE